MCKSSRKRNLAKLLSLILQKLSYLIPYNYLVPENVHTYKPSHVREANVYPLCDRAMPALCFDKISSFRLSVCVSVCLPDYYGHTPLPTVIKFGTNVPKYVGTLYQYKGEAMYMSGSLISLPFQNGSRFVSFFRSYDQTDSHGNGIV